MIGSGFERRSESSGGADAQAVAGPRVRVYELAKELGVANRDLLERIRAMGLEVANHMSHLESADVDRVRRSLTRERHESLVEERLTDTVIRRRSKAPAPVPAPAGSPTRSATSAEAARRHAAATSAAPSVAPAPSAAPVRPSAPL